MNAIDFVKKFGIKEAKRIVEYRDNHVKSAHVFKFNESCVDNGVINGGAYLYTKSYNDYSVSVDDLKQIFDAFELVEYCHGLSDAKELLEEINSEKWVYNLYTNTVISVDYAPSEDMCIRYNVLEKAINLVEKCQK